MNSTTFGSSVASADGFSFSRALREILGSWFAVIAVPLGMVAFAIASAVSYGTTSGYLQFKWLAGSFASSLIVALLMIFAPQISAYMRYLRAWLIEGYSSHTAWNNTISNLVDRDEVAKKPIVILLWPTALVALVFSCLFASNGVRWIHGEHGVAAGETEFAIPFVSTIRAVKANQSIKFDAPGVTSDGVQVLATIKATLALSENPGFLTSNEQIKSDIEAEFGRKFQAAVSTLKAAALTDHVLLEYRVGKSADLSAAGVVWNGPIAIEVHPSFGK